MFLDIIKYGVPCFPNTFPKQMMVKVDNISGCRLSKIPTIRAWQVNSH